MLDNKENHLEDTLDEVNIISIVCQRKFMISFLCYVNEESHWFDPGYLCIYVHYECLSFISQSWWLACFFILLTMTIMMGVVAKRWWLCVENDSRVIDFLKIILWLDQTCIMFWLMGSVFAGSKVYRFLIMYDLFSDTVQLFLLQFLHILFNNIISTQCVA